MIKITGRDMVWSFFNKELGMSYTEDFRGCLYVPDKFKGKVAQREDVALAIGYNSFRGNTCSIHIVVNDRENALNRRTLREIFEYPFIDCARTHVIAPVDSKNEESLTICRKGGFKEIYRFPEGADDGDLVIFSMSREECPWLGKEKSNG